MSHAEACPRCEEPLAQADEGAAERQALTCAACGAGHHVGCEGSGCARPGCALARPSHPAWTLEERARGPWLFVPAAPRGATAHAALLGAVVLAAAIPQHQRLLSVAEAVVAGVPDAPPWAAYSVVAAGLVVPFAALALVALLHHHRHRPVLIDRLGLLFDHSPAWHGARLAWPSIAGFRLVEGGVRLVVRGRPWTRLVGPLIPCEGERQHEMVVLLEGVGVRRFEG
ncbi:MAG: hypothetical protein M9894_38000 [Planctomycetes bacterium]|nr:hypothetical protein [Planctomycetota bacterium]